MNFVLSTLSILFFCFPKVVQAEHFVVGLDVDEQGDISGSKEHLIYDSSRVPRTQPHFSEDQCASEKCFLHQTSGLMFYGQFASHTGQLRFDKPVVTSKRYLHTPHTLTLETAVNTFPSPSKSLGPEEVVSIELEFNCIATGTSEEQIAGFFDVRVDLPLHTKQDDNAYKTSNVTWFFRKRCLGRSKMAKLTVVHNDVTVVKDGATQSLWDARNPSVYDVGLSQGRKNVRFSLRYNDYNSPLQFIVQDPVFDEDVIKSVTTSVAPGVLHAGTNQNFDVTVTCQQHPHREASPGDVTVGFWGLANDKGTAFKKVVWKFRAECPYHGNTITPFGVLGIVVSLFFAVGMVSGYVFNTQFTHKRGVAAIPFYSTIRMAMRQGRQGRRSKRNYPLVEEDELTADLLDEEILPTVQQETQPRYGAV